MRTLGVSMTRRLLNLLAAVAFMAFLTIALAATFGINQWVQGRNPPIVASAVTPTATPPPTPLPPKAIYEQTPFPDPAYNGLTPQPIPTPALFTAIIVMNE